MFINFVLYSTKSFVNLCSEVIPCYTITLSSLRDIWILSILSQVRMFYVLDMMWYMLRTLWIFISVCFICFLISTMDVFISAEPGRFSLCIYLLGINGDIFCGYCTS